MLVLGQPQIKSQITHALTNFHDLLEYLQKHECQKSFSIELKNKLLFLTCKNCAEEFHMPLGQIMHTTPDHLIWMFHSHEGRLHFVQHLKEHKILTWRD